MQQQFIQFLDACYPFGYPLLCCSIFLLAAILYHLINRSSTRDFTHFLPLWQRAREGNAESIAAFRAQVMQSHKPIAKELRFLIENKDNQALDKQVEAHLSLYIDRERAGLALISLISNISPMLGILGTAWGLVDIFGVFGSADAQMGIAMGISKALYTTIFGIAIAVPGIIALTIFERSLEQRATRIIALFTDIIAKRSSL